MKPQDRLKIYISFCMHGLLTSCTGFALVLSVRIPPAGAQPDDAKRLSTLEISPDASALSQSAIASQQVFQFEVMKQDWVRFYTAAERMNSHQLPHSVDDVWGRYSDSNREQQSFSRLTHQLGDFSLAANLFNWRYRQDLEESSGYFSPPDFLVANGEVAWQGTITSWLDCRTAINFGWQRLSGTWSSVFGYDLFCAAQISKAVGLDLGYRFSNVNDQVSAYNSNGIEGRVRARF